MAETLTPNTNPTTNQRQRPPMAARLQSPTSPFFLGSNDDQLERAQARAARAAAFRRKPVDIPPPSRPSLSSTSCLDREQIIELFHNCVKLASENKINQKNTWELKLIDHLSEIIQVEAEDDSQTNFQKASCSLEAGVKIYAVRVDAWHADAYRVLRGIGRVGLEDQQETLAGEGTVADEKDEYRPNKETERKVSSPSTVESSFEALNVKKFDVAFAVDPLYRQTSAQFDEGGSKGLLLYNLGVHGGCRVIFDSKEVPGKCMLGAHDSNNSDQIDISFARESIDQMITNMCKAQEISPSLRDMIGQVDKCSFPAKILGGVESNAIGNMQQDNDFRGSVVAESTGVQIDDGSGDDAGIWSTHYHDNVTVSDEGSHLNDPTMQHYHEDGVPLMSDEADMDDSLASFSSLFCAGLVCTSRQTAWAGPDHWKYRKPKGPASVCTPDFRPDCEATPPKDKKSLELDINFTRSLDEEVPNIFVPAKNMKALLLPPRKAPCSHSLPEDYHYQPEDLLKLFLLPNVMCLGKCIKRVSGSDSWQQGIYSDVLSPAWDDEGAFSGHCDDGFTDGAVEQDTLIPQPRQVNKIELQYDRTSKQVDVHMLKETLWHHMQGCLWTPGMQKTCKDGVSFRRVLATLPEDCPAAATHDDISPHLCFICILHLANEHGLTIRGYPNLDDLSIHLPAAFENADETI